jgi:IclR family transcriptional regulator, acetate operon repressor
LGIRDPLGHSLELLRWMGRQDKTHFGVRRIASALGLQPSTISRLLRRLSDEGIVRKDPISGEYGFGLELIRLGLLASKNLDVQRIARPCLEQIAAECNETSILAIYDSTRNEMLRVDKVDSTHPLNYTIKMDEWTEIYRGASGLGILAFLPQPQRDSVVTIADAAATDEEPWLKRENLTTILDDTRARGYACTHGRRLSGAVAVSAPIMSISGDVVGDIIVTVPEVRWADHREADLAKLVMDAAATVSNELGAEQPK